MIEPRPAATVVVVRDSDQGLEVLLLRRTDEAVFMPGAYVFPGGAVDRQDHDPALLSRAPGVDVQALNRSLAVADGGMGFLAAAIRECFEEAGLLLAEPGSSEDVDFDRWRRALASGEVSLSELCRELDLTLHANRFGYLSRWITPPGHPRRFDTRFFVAPAPPGQAVRHDGVEITAHLWISPREALERCRRGDLSLAEPTLRTVELLSAFEDAGELLQSTRLDGPTLRPALPADGRDGMRLVHPSEPAFAEIARLHDLGVRGATYEIIPGVPQRLSPRVRRLTAANPGVMTGPGTNTYLVDGSEGLAVIDPGPLLDAHTEAILEEAGGEPVHAILVTHTHRDHSPGARLLKERTGAPVLGMPPPEDASHDGAFAPDRVMEHGERLDLGGATLRAVHTPGHASNHLCYLLEEENLLFSGDHIMQGSTVVINPPDGNMAEYLESLEMLHGEEITHIAPGHGFLMADPGAVIDRIVNHRLKREAKVLDAVRRL
ncbi:MAG: MBL fold metallo-hydrolase, partial [Arenicellales bacterium]